MSLSDLASLGSFVSGFAVLGSLVYLTLQLRQADRNQRAAVRQGRINRAVEMVIGKLAPGPSAAVLRGIDGDPELTFAEFAMFTSYAEAYFLHAEDTYYQHEAGLLDDEGFATFVAYQQSAFRQPGLRVQWKRQRPYYCGKFAAFMDKVLSETILESGADAFEQWKSDVAAEKELASA